MNEAAEKLSETKNPVQKYLSTHFINDRLILEFCSKKLYLIASKEIPRALNDLNQQISDLRHLEKLLIEEWYEDHPDSYIK